MRLGDKFILIIGAVIIILLLVSCGNIRQSRQQQWEEDLWKLPQIIEREEKAQRDYFTH